MGLIELRGGGGGCDEPRQKRLNNQQRRIDQLRIPVILPLMRKQQLRRNQPRQLSVNLLQNLQLLRMQKRRNILVTVVMIHLMKRNRTLQGHQQGRRKILKYLLQKVR